MEQNNRVAKALINNVFAMKKDELITITFDKGSNTEIIDTLLDTAQSIGANALALEIPEPKAACSGVNDYVPPVVSKVLAETDCWFDAGSKVWIYSRPFEDAFKDNEKLRYMVAGDIDTDGLSILFENIDFTVMKKLTTEFTNLIKNGKTMRFKSEKGSDIRITLNHTHVVAADNGDVSTPGFFTPPALINVVPRFDSSCGKIVSDAVMIDGEWRVVKTPLEIEVNDGKIVSIKGDEKDSKDLTEWLKINGDDNSYKVGHMSIGLSPNIPEIMGNIFYDERVYGSMNWGFGHVSPIDAPPNGLPSNTHFDAVTEKASIWIDDIQVLDKGDLVHPALEQYSKILLG